MRQNQWFSITLKPCTIIRQIPHLTGVIMNKLMVIYGKGFTVVRLCYKMTHNDDFYPNMNLRSCHASFGSTMRKRNRIMCVPLEKIRGMSANDILDEVGIRGEVPIRLNRVFEHFGITVAPYDFTEMELSPELVDIVNKRGNILGMIISDGDRAGILYNKHDTPNRQRFTIAHELAHCAQADGHITRFVEFRRDRESNDEKEIMANIFAGELLIPKESLLEFCHNNVAPSVDLLAKAFAISINVMKARLTHLGVIHGC